MLKLTLPNINYLAFKKTDDMINDMINDTINDTINEPLKSVIDIIATHPGIKRKRYSCYYG